MEDINFQFQALLNDISENLGSDELKAMKFFCRDLLRSNQLGRADSGHKLFIALQEKGFIDVSDTFLVAELLYRTKQFKLLKKMRYDRWEVSRQLKDPAKARISLYRQLLFEVSEDITMKDLEAVKHFLHNCLSKSKLESITTMLDVFIEMEKEGLLEEGNMELLKKICKELGEHLVMKFDHYKPLISAQCSTGKKDENGGRQGEESVVVLAPTPETTFPVILSPQTPPSAEQCGLPRSLEAHSPSRVQFSRLPDMKEQDGNSFHSQNIESLSRYKMESNPRGYCVIINNHTFAKMAERRGSHVDADRLIRIFRWLGFDVDPQENLTAAGMQGLMNKYQAMDHTLRDCFVCCILTHGEKGVMCGTDGQHVAISEITSFFTGRQCPTLREKPKLFFIQACQGTKKQDSVGVELSGVGVEPSGVGVEPSGVGVEPSGVGVKHSSVETEPSSTTLEQDAVSTNATIPDEADFLLGMATVEGYVSFRHIQQGTWYIQSLCENLEKYSASEDLLSILTIVNRDVSGKKDNKDKTQMPQPRYTLRKKLYFPVTQTYTNFMNSS
ncbi:caspase-8-like isoform X2 [Carcharodon carcharias]|uniref:caspase-8-like isoform X2 n=1 Tax=Carcharodon carcharias TaxID=13397 RepID=UPI001B7E7C27|nr:caspase-8-like isoform X2 [Carcharodon carcharias]